MNKLIMDTLALLFAMVLVAIKHDDPAKESAAIVIETRKVLADLPPGSVVAKLLEAAPDPVEDFLIGLAASTVVHYLNSFNFFGTGGSGSSPS